MHEREKPIQINLCGSEAQKDAGAVRQGTPEHSNVRKGEKI